MKFGKVLEEQAVSEWKSKYIDYDQLKKSIKRIVAKLGIDRRRSMSELSMANLNEQNFSRPLTEEEKSFLSDLTLEVHKVEEFFYSQLHDAAHKTDDLVHQLELLDKEEKLGHEQQHTRKHHFFPLSQKDDDKEQPTVVLSSKTDPGPFSSQEAHHLTQRPKAQSQFMTPYLRQLSSRNTTTKSHHFFEPFEKPIIFTLKSNIYQYLHQNNLQLARLQLKKALLELYRSLELLKSYQNMNILAYTKIVKKFEKNTHCQMKDILMKELFQTKFYHSTELSKLFKQVENLYKSHYAHGNRSKAIKNLRTLNNEFVTIQSYVFPIYSAGFFTGMNILLIIFILIHLTSVLDRPHSLLNGKAAIYFGLGFPFLISNLMAINMYIWDLYKINYRLICGVNPKTSTADYASYVSMITTIYLSLVFISLTGYMDPSISPVMQIWLIIILICGVLLIPSPWNDYYLFSSRRWLARVMTRIITAPYKTCRFTDFFLADQLVSIAPFFQSIGYLIYASKEGSSVLNVNLPFIWYIHFLPMIPFYFRCLQSLRRYYDAWISLLRNQPRNISISNIQLTPEPTQVYNCLRYLLGIVVLILIAIQKGDGNKHPFLIDIVLSIRLCYTIISTYWDINMDWGLGQGRMFYQSKVDEIGSSKHGKMIIYPFWVYVAVISINILARFLWLPFLLYQRNHNYSIEYGWYTLGLVEIFRRFQWNFIRVEIEHVHNCEKYQVTTEIALPFTSQDLFYHVDPDTEDHDEEDGDGEINPDDHHTNTDGGQNSLKDQNLQFHRHGGEDDHSYLEEGGVGIDPQHHHESHPKIDFSGGIWMDSEAPSREASQKSRTTTVDSLVPAPSSSPFPFVHSNATPSNPNHHADSQQLRHHRDSEAEREIELMDLEMTMLNQTKM